MFTLVYLCIVALPTFVTAQQPDAKTGSQGVWEAAFTVVSDCDDPKQCENEAAAASEPVRQTPQRLNALEAIPAAAELETRTVSPQLLTELQYLVAQQPRGPQAKVDNLIEVIEEPDILLEIDPRRSKIFRTKQPPTKVSVTDPQILEISPITPTEYELIGGASGQTSLTFWFGDPDQGGKLIRYLVKVAPNEAIEDRRKIEYTELERKINEFFPNSMVQLVPIADKLIVRGQARDAEEATHIMTLITSEATDVGTSGRAGRVNIGSAAEPFPGVSDLPVASVINMLHVTGEMQVLLKVRVAELTRSAKREMGVELSGTTGDFSWQTLLGLGGAVNAVLNADDVLLVVEALKTTAYAKILAEPNLVTLSGHSASFLAGGEFAVPVVVGVEGAAAATTNFRSFGTQLVFTPTVLDRDRIRLHVAPSFSSLNKENSVDGIPGLDHRSVSTTVDLREGQWLAIAGLLQDEQTGSNARVPFIGDVPVLGTLFSRRDTTRDETELIVLVSPELVHPLEAEEAPSILPGMEVTDPSDTAFYFGGRIEGNPNRQYRSTVAAVNYRQAGDARRELKGQSHYQCTEDYYVQGPHGFSQ